MIPLFINSSILTEQVIDGEPQTLHSETRTFAKILLGHKDDEEGVWADKYGFFKEIFPYVYGGWCGVGKTIEDVVGMDERDLGRWFPKGVDFPVLGRELEEDEREKEREDFEGV